MIPYEEFRYGLVNGSIKFQPSSPQVKKLLNQQSLDKLIGLRLPKNTDSNFTQLHFSTEDLITVTSLTKAEDSYGRTSTDNHTVIIKISDYLNVYPPLELVKNLF